MAIDVFVADEQSDHPVDTLRWARLAEAVLLDEGVRGDVELSVLFVDETAMAELNQRFRGRRGPTDVLAFPIDDEPTEGGRSPDSGGTGPGWVPPEPEDLPAMLGDVVICPAVAYRNALLLVHGILHLRGMDHEDDEDASEMERREQELLARHHRGRDAEGGPVAPGG
jgi:probable rRNA maturation factor